MSHNSKSKWVDLIPPFLLITVIVAICIIGIILLNGSTTVVENPKDDIVSKALNCQIKNHNYPFFSVSDDEVAESATQINMVFNGNKVRSISLIHKIIFNTAAQANASKSINHAAMNSSFGNELGADALNAHYTVVDTSLTMNLYAEQKDLTAKTRKYFLLEQDTGGTSGYKKIYEKQGFTCQEK